MKLVAKIFIWLNEVLLFIAVFLLPTLFVVFAIKNPTSLGMNNLSDGGWWLLALGLILWELFVVSAFGMLAILIANYNNLTIIADHVAKGSGPTDMSSIFGGAKADRRSEPRMSKEEI